MNEEFEKFWTKHTTIVATLRSPKDYAQHIFESGQAAVAESITTNSFGQHHYQRGYKDGTIAEREAIAQYIVDQGTIGKEGLDIYYIDAEDVSLIRSGEYE